MSSELCTPSAPPTARPQSTVRPTATTRAPHASALSTAVPPRRVGRLLPRPPGAPARGRVPPARVVPLPADGRAAGEVAGRPPPCGHARPPRTVAGGVERKHFRAFAGRGHRLHGPAAGA